MNDICTFSLRLDGQVSERELNGMSPIEMTAQSELSTTRLTFSTDQSGLLGLLSYLHGLGFVFLAFNRTETTSERLR